jgi:hypothetical protein
VGSRKCRRHSQESPSGWWAHQDLNLEPTDYESAALTVELWARGRTVLTLQLFLHTASEISAFGAACIVKMSVS